ARTGPVDAVSRGPWASGGRTSLLAGLDGAQIGRRTAGALTHLGAAIDGRRTRLEPEVRLRGIGEARGRFDRLGVEARGTAPLRKGPRAVEPQRAAARRVEVRVHPHVAQLPAVLRRDAAVAEDVVVDGDVGGVAVA